MAYWSSLGCYNALSWPVGTSWEGYPTWAEGCRLDGQQRVSGVLLRTFSGHSAWLESLTVVLSATVSAGGFTGGYLQKDITPLGKRVPEFNLAPQSSTFPSSTRHPSPSTDNPLTMQFR